jgi:chromosome condensin MukBEF MukE localization factor
VSYQKDRDEFISVVIQEGGDVETARLLLRHAKTYDRIQEMWCSEEMSDRRRGALEKKETNLERRITELAERFGAKVKFGGDPRGFTVKLLLKSGRWNSWGGASEGFGVPTR